MNIRVSLKGHARGPLLQSQLARALTEMRQWPNLLHRQLVDDHARNATRPVAFGKSACRVDGVATGCVVIEVGL
jgi:hypothetical protein